MSRILRAAPLLVVSSGLAINSHSQGDCQGVLGCIKSASHSALGFVQGLTHRGNLSGDQNLCMDGHIAPQLILYGPARASTSTFAQNLVRSSDVVFGACKGGPPDCPSEGWKEMHFFHDWDGSKMGKMSYLAHFPECTFNQRILASDLTPGQHVPSSKVFPKIESFYAEQPGKVHFVMLLREPMKCMQSFYHFEKQENKRSYESYAKSVLKAPGSHSFRYMNNVMYAEGLLQFLNSKTFRAQQLTIVPMQYNEGEKNGFKRATEFFWEKFGVKAGTKDKEVERANYNDAHVTVDQDLTAGTYDQLEKVLDKKTGPKVLANIITKACGIGDCPHLYGYGGDHSDVAAVEQWLKGGW